MATIRYDTGYFIKLAKKIHERHTMNDEFEKAMESLDVPIAKPQRPPTEYSCNLENPEICESCQ